MKFNILVCEGPYTHQASDSAYQFVNAALSIGHKIVRVFFYHDGVYNGTALSAPPSDDRDIVNQWIKLSRDHEIDLAVCIAASLRRGILSSESAKQYGKDAANINSQFQVAGIGYFIEGSIIADRTVIFGD